MNKAFGADFGTSNGQTRALSMGGMFDWTGNEALTDNSLKVRQAYWLYLGDKAFGADIPWTFSIGMTASDQIGMGFPVSTYRAFLGISSDPGDVVLDCFGGSGSTAVACIRNNRRYILIEKEKEYVEISAQRIEEEL